MQAGFHTSGCRTRGLQHKPVFMPVGLHASRFSHKRYIATPICLRSLQVAKALNYLHSRNVAHMDSEPHARLAVMDCA